MCVELAIIKRIFSAAGALTLSACAAQGVPAQIENVAGAPTMICSALLAQEASSLQQLKAILEKAP